MLRSKWHIVEYSQAIEKKAEKTLNLIAQFLVGDAKLRVPVDTGNLKSSITSVTPEKLTRQIGTNVHYALHVEFGTKNHPVPRPFLRPALDENLKQIQEFFNNTMLKI